MKCPRCKNKMTINDRQYIFQDEYICDCGMKVRAQRNLESNLLEIIFCSIKINKYYIRWYTEIMCTIDYCVNDYVYNYIKSFNCKDVHYTITEEQIKMMLVFL